MIKKILPWNPLPLKMAKNEWLRPESGTITDGLVARKPILGLQF